MRENAVMSRSELAPPGTFRATVAVWVIAALAAVGIGIAVPVDWRMAWMTVGLGACIVIAFVAHLVVGRPSGFIDRVATTIAGVFLIMGVVSAGFGLAALVATSLGAG